MQELLVPIIAVPIVLLFGVALYANRESRAETRRTGKLPVGHHKGRGMAFGIAIGAGLGAAMDALPIGIAVGVAMGVAIGAGLEKKHAGELRPMTEKEARMKRQGVVLAIGLLIATLLIAVGVRYFSA